MKQNTQTRCVADCGKRNKEAGQCTCMNNGGPLFVGNLTNINIAETWQPSVRLRFIEKTVEIDENLGRRVKVLQQLHTSNTGKVEWKDVELVENED